MGGKLSADDRATLRAKQFISYGLGGAIVVAVWVMCGLALAGKDVLHHWNEPDASTKNLYLIGSSILTVVVLLVSFLTAQKSRRLSNYGMWTDATVVKFGLFGKGGNRPVTFTYVVDGREYSVRKDVNITYAKYEIGSKVKTIYDPRKPRVASILPYDVLG